jgi:hypothetical protein
MMFGEFFSKFKTVLVVNRISALVVVRKIVGETYVIEIIIVLFYLLYPFSPNASRPSPCSKWKLIRRLGFFSGALDVFMS